MATSSPSELTQLLQACNQGDPTAFAQLTDLVEQELRKLARSYLRRERANHTLQPTALVNEAYLRLLGGKPVEWQSRNHFFGRTAQIMRHVLVECARARKGQALQVTIDNALALSHNKRNEVDMLALDEALTTFAQIDAVASQVVELRYFGGLSEAEAAAALQISLDTAKRKWRRARTWLKTELS